MLLRLHVQLDLVDPHAVGLEEALPDPGLERIGVRVPVIVPIFHEIYVDLVLAPDEVVQAVASAADAEEGPVEAAPALGRDLAPGARER